MITGHPLVTATDMGSGVNGAPATAGGVGPNAAAALLDNARARFTESVQFNNVLNQDPSPNMRAMVTYVEPTKIMVTYGPTSAPTSAPTPASTPPAPTPAPTNPTPAPTQTPTQTPTTQTTSAAAKVIKMSVGFKDTNPSSIDDVR
jgi:hypothetical protein